MSNDMKRSHPPSKGFIIVLTTSLIAIGVFLISLVVNRVNAYRHMSRLWEDREKARMIAWGGIEIAMDQLAHLDVHAQAQDEKKEKETAQQGSEKEQKDKTQEQAAKVRTVLSKINTWQTFVFKEELEGIDGQCDLYVSSEQGKINLNLLYDFKKKEFVGAQGGLLNGKKLLELLSEKLKPLFERSQQKSIQFEQVLADFFKKQSAPLDDVTQLLAVPQLAQMQEHLFVDPELKTNAVVLTDLFTVFTKTATIDPLLLSRSLKSVAGIPDATAKEFEKIAAKELLDLLKAPMISWEKSWSLLSTAYGKEYSAIPEILRALFGFRFEATTFSVVSYGRVGMSVQKVCAIIERNTDHSFSFKRLYWL